jgi:hypothetical protein
VYVGADVKLTVMCAPPGSFAAASLTDVANRALDPAAFAVRGAEASSNAKSIVQARARRDELHLIFRAPISIHEG